MQHTSRPTYISTTTTTIITITTTTTTLENLKVIVLAKTGLRCCIAANNLAGKISYSSKLSATRKDRMRSHSEEFPKWDLRSARQDVLQAQSPGISRRRFIKSRCGRRQQVSPKRPYIYIYLPNYIKPDLRRRCIYIHVNSHQLPLNSPVV